MKERVGRTGGELRRLARDRGLLLVLVVVVALVATFVVFPLFQVFRESIFPRGQFDATHFLRFFQGAPFLVTPFFNSLILGGLVALTGTVVGFTFAFAIARANVPGKRVFRWIATLPMISPPFIMALAAILLLGNRGMITQVFHNVFGVRWSIYGLPGLVLTQTLAYFPVAFMALEGVLRAIDRSTEEAALDLGASKLRTFIKVTLPLAAPGIGAALLLLFVISLGDFGNPIVIGGRFQVLTVQAYLAITGRYNMPLGATLAILLLIPTALVFIVQRYWLSRRSHVTVTGRPTPSTAQSSGPLLRWVLFGVLCFLSGVILLFYGMVVYGAFTHLWGVNHALTMDNFRYVFSVGRRYFMNTVQLAAIATPIGGILGILIAFLVTRKRFPGRKTLDFLSMMNFAVPGIVVGIGYLLAFNAPPLRLTGTAAIILAVFVFQRMPVAIRDGAAMLQQVDAAIDESASDLGAGFMRTFGRIVLPLVAPAMFSGMAYMFATCVTSISAVVMVVSARWQLMTVALLNDVDNAQLSRAAAWGVVIIVVVLAAIFVLDVLVSRLLSRRGSHGR